VGKPRYCTYIQRGYCTYIKCTYIGRGYFGRERKEEVAVIPAALSLNLQQPQTLQLLNRRRDRSCLKVALFTDGGDGWEDAPLGVVVGGEGQPNLGRGRGEAGQDARLNQRIGNVDRTAHIHLILRKQKKTRGDSRSLPGLDQMLEVWKYRV